MCILRAISNDVRAKILQHFIGQEPTIAALKVYANNLIASEHRMSGEAKAVKGALVPNPNLLSNVESADDQVMEK